MFHLRLFVTLCCNNYNYHYKRTLNVCFKLKLLLLHINEWRQHYSLSHIKINQQKNEEKNLQHIVKYNRKMVKKEKSTKFNVTSYVCDIPSLPHLLVYIFVCFMLSQKSQTDDGNKKMCHKICIFIKIFSELI